MTAPDDADARRLADPDAEDEARAEETPDPLPPETGSFPLEAEPADALEQRQELPTGDDEYPPS